MRPLLSPVASLFAVSALAIAGAHTPAPASPAPAPPVSPAKPVNTGGSSADNEAAAKHAKRTACINQARAKKLVGAQKGAYIKDCIAPS